MLNRSQITGMRAADWQWYRVQNRQNAEGQLEVAIDIYDEISPWGTNAETLAPQIRALPADARITVGVNSPGGDVFDGYAIGNALRSHPGHVTTRVDGIAASIASYIFAAGDERLMHEESMLMWHRAWGMAIGNAKDHMDLANTLLKIDSQLSNVLRRTTNMEDLDQIEAMLDAETWLTPAEAAELGHVQIIESPDIAASQVRFDLRGYHNVPETLQELVDPERLAQAQAEVETTDSALHRDREIQVRRMQNELQKRARSIA